MSKAGDKKTIYFTQERLDLLNREMKKTGRSASSIIGDALDQHYEIGRSDLMTKAEILKLFEERSAENRRIVREEMMNVFTAVLTLHPGEARDRFERIVREGVNGITEADRTMMNGIMKSKPP
jgi:hypothetical protein